MLNIPELVPPRNQCQQFRESVPTNSYHTRNQLPLIHIDSRNRLRFRPIPCCINPRNSDRFRNHMIIVRFPYSTTGICIQFRNEIPGIDSDSGIARNSREFLPIPEFRELVSIPEFLTGITRLPSPSCIVIRLKVIPSEHSPIPVRNSGNRIETEFLTGIGSSLDPEVMIE